MLRLPEKGDEDNHPIGSGKVFFTDIFSGIKTRNTVCRKTQEGGKGGREEDRKGGKGEKEGGREKRREEGGGRRTREGGEGWEGGRKGGKEERKEERKKSEKKKRTTFRNVLPLILGGHLQEKMLGQKFPLV